MRHRFLYFAYLIGLLFCEQITSAQLTTPSQHLEITGQHTLQIIYNYTLVWPVGGGYSAVFHLPLPPNTGTQQITTVISSLKGEIKLDQSSPPRRILTIVVHHERGNERRLEWQVRITGKFQTRQLADGPPTPTTSPIELPPPGDFLASTESIDWKSDTFQAWLQATGLRRQAREAPVQYGQRVYAYLQSHGRYSYPPVGGWTASGAAHRLCSDCGGFSLVFAAACRANQIPARLLVGQWFKTKQSVDGKLEQTGRQAHVITEFFDPQIGWIPEDISSTFLQTPGYADLNFFGRDPGYFFAWHIDTDFHFVVPTKTNEHIQWIQNPSPWFSANAEGAENSSRHWKLEVLQ